MSGFNPTAIVAAAGFWSYAVVFLLTAAETSAFLGVFLPGESLVLVAGALAGRGDLDPVALITVVVGACVIGDSAGYALGRWYGHRPGSERLRRRTARAHDFLQRRGGQAVFAGRFVGFVRSFVPFAAGGSGLPYRRFLPYSAVAALLWGAGNVLAGYFLGASAERLLRTVGVFGAGAVVGAVLAGFLVRAALRRRSARGVSAPAEAAPAPTPAPARRPAPVPAPPYVPYAPLPLCAEAGRRHRAATASRPHRRLAPRVHTRLHRRRGRQHAG